MNTANLQKWETKTLELKCATGPDDDLRCWTSPDRAERLGRDFN